MSKAPWEMTFEEFYGNARPGGTVNRLPEMNRGMPVYSYSVFLNGPVANDLAEGSRQFDFKDVMVTALTRQLGLDPKSFRDNLKVSELAAARSAWMESVSAEHHRNQAWGMDEVPGDVMKDYEVLSKGMVHPFIQKELEGQRKLTGEVQVVLDDASRVTGKKVEDLAPDEVSVGRVVSQSTDFTVQETSAGEVVTHENRRLESMPKIGDHVSVSYYRGSGQVVDSLVNVRVDAPFIDKESGDLAIKLWDGQGKGQVVLFNSITGFDKFVKAHGLDNELVAQAIDARVATPKKVAEKPVKVLVGDVYVDETSKCLAVNYTENDVPGQVLFASARMLETQAKDYGIDGAMIGRARELEVEQRKVSDPEWYVSFKGARAKAEGLGAVDASEPTKEKGSYDGVVVAVEKLHVVQNVGNNKLVIHCTRGLGYTPVEGQRECFGYDDGKVSVKGAREAGKVKELGRG